MKIAIVGSFDYHFECVPFLLEVFKKDYVTIYTLKKKDKYNDLVQFKKMYNFNVILNEISPDIIASNDLTIKLTSNDPCLENEKIVSIQHWCNKVVKKTISGRILSLTPYINKKSWLSVYKSGDPEVHYTFPAYNPFKTIEKVTDKVVTFIGYYLNRQFDKDILDFIKLNEDYTFNFIVRGEKSRNYPVLKGIQNVNCYNNIEGEKVVELLKSARYILSKRHINYDRFSGQLGLSVSYEKPLLVDKRTMDVYKLPGISFEKNYMELGKLSEIDDKKYDELWNKVKKFKTDAIKKNTEILRGFK